MESVRGVELEGRRVLVRADFNVPMEDGSIVDESRIHATLPTIQYLLEHGAAVILCSHLGRPGGEPKEDLRMDPVAKRLKELLGKHVTKLDDCVGDEVERAVERMRPRDIILLENLRFHPEEEENDHEFSRRLAVLADLFVNDAFGAAHRAHASTEGVTHHLPAVAGLLMEREVGILGEIREHPERPFFAILGGAKIADKIDVIEWLLEQTDRLLVGGAMANTFLKAQGKEVGDSLVEEGSLDEARRLADRAGDRLVLPVDVVIADAFDSDAARRNVGVDHVPPSWRILDIGPETRVLFEDQLQDARTIVWNGPLGAFEVEPFAAGTYAMAATLAGLDAMIVVGGGETAMALAWAGLTEEMTHVSTGGGAFLEFMEGKELPGVAALQARAGA